MVGTENVIKSCTDKLSAFSDRYVGQEAGCGVYLMELLWGLNSFSENTEMESNGGQNYYSNPYSLHQFCFLCLQLWGLKEKKGSVHVSSIFPGQEYKNPVHNIKSTFVLVNFIFSLDYEYLNWWNCTCQLTKFQTLHFGLINMLRYDCHMLGALGSWQCDTN